jgi:hypothetical protein
LPLEVGLPPTKVVIHVDSGNATVVQPLFQLGDAARGGQSEAQQLFALWEVEIVNDVNEQ